MAPRAAQAAAFETSGEVLGDSACPCAPGSAGEAGVWELGLISRQVKSKWSAVSHG